MERIIEEKINYLDKITKRLMRRSNKHSVAMITPYPISNAVFGDAVRGVILRYMFPCEGVISKGLIKLDRKPKEGVVIGIKIFNDSKSNASGFKLEKKSFSTELELSVSSGDCLEVSLDPLTENITEVWLSFLWKPLVKDVEIKSFLIEDLENGLSSEEKMITE